MLRVLHVPIGMHTYYMYVSCFLIRFPTNQHLREPRLKKASPSCPRLSPGRAMCRKALATLFPLSLVIVETQHAFTAPSGRASVEAGEGETAEHGQKYKSCAPEKTLRGRSWELRRLSCRRLSFQKIISPVHACSVPHLTFSIGSCATLHVHEAVRGLNDTWKDCRVV